MREQGAEGADGNARLTGAVGMVLLVVLFVEGITDLVEDLAGYSLTVHGKGGHIRVVPLADDVAELVIRACQDGAGWALPGDDHGHLSPRSGTREDRPGPTRSRNC